MNKSIELIDFLIMETKTELLERLRDKTDSLLNEKTELYCFFADPADHSLSPNMYNRAFNRLNLNSFYFASTIPNGRIREAMKRVRKFDIRGVNISMPHKQRVMNELYEVDSMANLCEAVNTVVWEEGDLKGYNTDYIGAIKAIEDLFCEGISLKDSINEAVVFGLGGAGKAVIVGLAKEGVKRINVFVRHNRAIEYSKYATRICNEFPGVSTKINILSNRKEVKGRIADSQLLINTTNVGMGKYEGKSLLPDPSFLHKDIKVMDVIYAPEKTELLVQAERAGCQYVNGIPMLLHQGEAAFKLYTGIDTKLDF